MDALVATVFVVFVYRQACFDLVFRYHAILPPIAMMVTMMILDFRLNHESYTLNMLVKPKP